MAGRARLACQQRGNYGARRGGRTSLADLYRQGPGVFAMLSISCTTYSVIYHLSKPCFDLVLPGLLTVPVFFLPWFLLDSIPIFHQIPLGMQAPTRPVKAGPFSDPDYLYRTRGWGRFFIE